MQIGPTFLVKGNQLAVYHRPSRQTAKNIYLRIASRIVRPLPAPESPTPSFHGGQRPNPIPFDLKRVCGRVERLRRHGQHGQDLRQHHAVLRARFRAAFSLTRLEVCLPLPACTLSLSASNSDKIARGGAVASTGCPASLASIKLFSSCAAWSA